MEEKIYFPVNRPTLAVENGTKPGLSATAPDKLHRDFHSTSVSGFPLLSVGFHKPTDPPEVSSHLCCLGVLSATAPDKLHRDFHSTSVSGFPLLSVGFHKPTDPPEVSSHLCCLGVIIKVCPTIYTLDGKRQPQ